MQLVITVVDYTVSCFSTHVYIWCELGDRLQRQLTVSSLCALRAKRMVETSSPASSSSDGEEAKKTCCLSRTSSMKQAWPRTAQPTRVPVGSTQWWWPCSAPLKAAVWSKLRLASWRSLVLASVARAVSFCEMPSTIDGPEYHSNKKRIPAQITNQKCDI